MSTNPLLAPWETPFGAPPFDLIRPEHFAPAFDSAMAEHLAEIEAIATHPAPPDFANTIAAMERSGRALRRVAATFGNLVASNGNAALQEVERAMAPRLAAHSSRIGLDPRLFARVDALHRRRATLGLAPTSCACWSARTWASCAPAPRWMPRSATAWPKSPRGSPPCTPISARTCCTTSATGPWRWTKPASPACPASWWKARARPPRSAGCPATSSRRRAR